jgi:ribosomal protein S18 acetylase RimI-like enzyme
MNVPSSSEVLIRPATSTDAKNLAEIQRSAVLNSFPGHYDQKIIAAFLSLINTSRFAIAPDQPARLVAEWNGLVIGYGSFWPTGKIAGIYVSAQHQRLGIGRKLLQAIEAKSREDRLPILSLEATLPAVEFYVFLGFKRRKVVEHLLTITPLMSMRVVEMEKRL